MAMSSQAALLLIKKGSLQTPDIYLNLARLESGPGEPELHFLGSSKDKSHAPSALLAGLMHMTQVG